MQNGKTSLKVSDEIELRLPDLLFAEELFEVIDSQRDYMRNWLSWVDQTHSVEHTKAFLKSSKEFNRGGQRLTTFIFKSGHLVGSIGLVKIDKVYKNGEIGYWLREDFQGNGIITQSCRRLIDYAFKHVDLNRIEIKVASRNVRSLKIPKTLGFSHEGTLREALYIHQHFFDLELFSCLKREWNDVII